MIPFVEISFATDQKSRFQHKNPNNLISANVSTFSKSTSWNVRLVSLINGNFTTDFKMRFTLTAAETNHLKQTNNKRRLLLKQTKTMMNNNVYWGGREKYSKLLIEQFG